MKKNILLIGILISTIANAQTIAAGDTLTLGDSKLYFRADTSTTEMDNVVGANTIWDYTGLLMEYGVSSSTNTVIDISTSAYASDFPNAQYHEDFPEGIQSFFTNTATGVEVEGFVFTSAGVDYRVAYDDDNLNALVLPMNLGDTIIDNIEGTAFAPWAGSTATADITGTATITADGTGTLKIGNNTYANSIRVKTVETSSGNAVVNGAPVGPISVVRRSFAYYSNSTTDHFPILVIGKVIITLPGNALVTQKIVWSQINTENYLTVIDDSDMNPGFFRVFPNPAKNAVTVSTVKGSEAIRIFNTVGMLIKEIKAPKSIESVDISGMSSGVYFVSVTDKGETKTEKLVIK